MSCGDWCGLAHDPTAANHGVAIIKDGGLTGGDSALGRAELDFGLVAGKGLDGGVGAWAVAGG